MLNAEDDKKKGKIFKDALLFQEAAVGVAIQKVPVAYLLRILRPIIDARAAELEKGNGKTAHQKKAHEKKALELEAMKYCPDKTDPLIHAIYSLDTTFPRATKQGVDPLSSAEAIAGESHGTKNENGCLFLAWKTTYSAKDKRFNPPVVVGSMCVYNFKETENFGTNPGAFSPATQDRDSDSVILESYFYPVSPGTKFMYIDTLVSSAPGVGNVLALHAYRYAITKKARGLIALSYADNPNETPESYNIFIKMGFNVLIERARYTTRQWGTWFVVNFKEDGINFQDVLTSGIELCTRAGFTEKTKDRLVWRCPR
jgi:hypothetical protein